MMSRVEEVAAMKCEMTYLPRQARKVRLGSIWSSLEGLTHSHERVHVALRHIWAFELVLAVEV